MKNIGGCKETERWRDGERRKKKRDREKICRIGETQEVEVGNARLAWSLTLARAPGRECSGRGGC